MLGFTSFLLGFICSGFTIFILFNNVLFLDFIMNVVKPIEFSINDILNSFFIKTFFFNFFVIIIYLIFSSIFIIEMNYYILGVLSIFVILKTINLVFK